MRNIILLTLFVGVTNLFAQQIDTNLVRKINAIDQRLENQHQILDSLTTLINDQKYMIDSINTGYMNLNKELNEYKHDLVIKDQIINTLTKKVNRQKINVRATKAEISNLKDKLIKQNKFIDSLSNIVTGNSQKIDINSRQLGTEINNVKKDTDTRISILDNTFKDYRLYWIMVSLLILTLGVIMYFFIRKKIKLSKTDVETQIMNTKKALDEEMINLDSKLVEVLEKQLTVIQENKTIVNDDNKEKDHSLVLKIADRLTAMEMNHYRMDPKTKGLKALKKAVANIKANYKVEGYEIVDMLGKEYKEGLNVIANFIPSEEIEKGKKIITRIIKPQVNYKGKMIQAAEIEVSVGE